MPRARTTDDLLSDVRARVAAPAANGLISSAELLTLCDEEMRGEIASVLISTRSEYWLRTYEVAITAGLSSYRIPDRAIGMTLRDVTVYDADAHEWNAVQVPAEQRHLYTGATWTPAGPFAFTLSDGHIILLPAPTQGGYSLRVRYYASPSRLTTVADSAYIVDPGDGQTDLVVSSESTATAIQVNARVDVIRGGGMFDPIYEDNVVASYSAGTPPRGDLALVYGLTLSDLSNPTTSDHPGTRHDFICVAGMTVYPPLPEVMWPMLVTASARAYCEAVGDMRGMEAASMMYERRKRAALALLQPRVDGELMPPVPVSTPLRHRSRWGR